MGNSQQSLKKCMDCIGERPLATLGPIFRLDSNYILECTAYFEEEGLSPGVNLQVFSEVINHGTRGPKTKTVEDLAPVFEQFDDDHNGRTCIFEIFAAMILGSNMSTNQKIHAVFETFDINNDRHLSRDEAVIMTRSILRGAAKLTGGDIPLTSHIEDVCNATFEKADSIHDGKITYVEWLGFVRAEPAVILCLEKLEQKTRRGSFEKIQDFDRARDKSFKREQIRVAQEQHRMQLDDASLESHRKASKKSNRPQRPNKNGRGVQVKAKLHKQRPSNRQTECSKYSKRDILDLKKVFDDMCDEDSSEVHLNDLRGSLNPTMSMFSESMFHVLDQDNSGKVTLMEFLKVMFPNANARDHRQWMKWVTPPKPKTPQKTYTAEGMAEMRHLFELYDRSHDGFVTVEDLVSASGLEYGEILKMISSELGKTHDVKISFDEFVQLLGPLLEEQVEQV